MYPLLLLNGSFSVLFPFSHSPLKNFALIWLMVKCNSFPHLTEMHLLYAIRGSTVQNKIILIQNNHSSRLFSTKVIILHLHVKWFPFVRVDFRVDFNLHSEDQRNFLVKDRFLFNAGSVFNRFCCCMKTSIV